MITHGVSLSLGVLVFVVVLAVQAQEPKLCSKWARLQKNQNTLCRGAKSQMFETWCPQAFAGSCGRGGGGGGGGSRPQPRPAPTSPPRTPPPKRVKPTPEQDDPNDPESMYKECCRAQGVDSACMPICTYKDIDLKPVFCNKKKHCETYLKVATYCGTNAQDNSDCCERKTKKPVCNVFCNGVGQFPELSEMFAGAEALKYGVCLEVFKEMNQCSVQEHTRKKQWEKRSWSEEKFPDAIAEYVQSECGGADE